MSTLSVQIYMFFFMIYDWYFEDGFPGVILRLIMSEKRFFQCGFGVLPGM